MLLWMCTWTLKKGINPIVKIWTVEWNGENSSRFESGNGITKENPNLGKTWKEKSGTRRVNSDNQHDPRDRRQNLGHCRQDIRIV